MFRSGSKYKSNIYSQIMKKTIEDVYINCKTDDECALNLLWELWQSKMQNVSVRAMKKVTTIKQKKKVWTSRSQKKHSVKVNVVSEMNQPGTSSDSNAAKENCTLVSQTTETQTGLLGTNMPCLHCDDVTVTCMHSLSDCSKNQISQYQNKSKFSKVRLSRPIRFQHKFKPVKITLPLRSKHKNEVRTCVIRVPVLLRPNLKAFLIPIISKAGQFSTSRAALMLQRYINNACIEMNTFQIDGASDVICKIHIMHKNSTYEVVNRDLDCSDVGSDDDLTDNESSEDPFYSENIIICQFDSVQHKRNIWKLHLKHGIIHVFGKDYIFNKAECVAEF